MRFVSTAAVTGFYRWWTSTLLSCLPSVLQRRLDRIGHRVDLVIAHQGDSILVRTVRGRVLETVSLTHDADIDITLTASDDSKFEPGPAAPLADPDWRSEDAEKSGDNSPVIREAARVIPLNSKTGERLTEPSREEQQTSRLVDSATDRSDDAGISQGSERHLLPCVNQDEVPDEYSRLYTSVGGRIREVDTAAVGRAPELRPAETDADCSPVKETVVSRSRYSVVAWLLERYKRGRNCLYLIPESELFLLELSYPLEAMENLEGVLRFDLEKHIPVSVQAVRYFYALNRDDRENRVDVDIAVMRSSDYDRMQQCLGRFASNGLVCTSGQFYRKYGSRIDFLRQKPETSLRSCFNFSNLHLATNFLLLGILIAMPFFMLLRGVSQIDQVSLSEIRRAGNIVKTINELNFETRYGSLLAAQIGSTPKAVEILAALSGTINDRAWLEQLSIHEGEISIRGEADSATTVSDDLSQTGLFEEIKFVSSIRKNPQTGKESFELEMRSKPDA